MKTHSSLSSFFISTFFLLFGSITAHATSFEPKFSSGLVAEVEGQSTFSSDLEEASDDSELTVEDDSSATLRVELTPEVKFGESIAVDATLIAEQVVMPEAEALAEGSYFEDHGVFVETLELHYTLEGATVSAGKFNPNFGSAWEHGRGIWSENLAQEYELTEKLGFGVSYAYSNPQFGTHTVGYSTFYSDTALDTSFVTEREEVDADDVSIPGNTEEFFSSYLFSIDGSDAFGLAGLSYHLSYRSLANPSEDEDLDSETGIAANIGYKVNTGEGMTTDLLLEYVSIKNVGLSLDDDGMTLDERQDRSYLSASVVQTILENWNVTVGYTVRSDSIEDSDEDAEKQTLLQLSAGYTIVPGLTLDAGWLKMSDVEENASSELGASLRYSVQF